MSTAVTISAGDRLSLTVFMAASIHAILILGLTFQQNDLADLDAPPSLEIILVQKHDDTAPEKADYLAQISQEGGGESDDRARPSNPFASTELNDNTGIAPQPIEAGQPEITELSNEPPLTQLYSDHQIALTEQTLESKTEKQHAEDSFDYDLEIARLTAELNIAQEAYAKRPRKKVLTASTYEYVPARYMAEWVEKVERIGNLNYPDEALRNKINGTLMLEVEIRANGSIVEINVLKSSGHQILDDAAKRIVNLSSPFASFPSELRESADHIEIIRTWQFLDGGINTR